MLPRSRRLTRGRDISATLRHGRRVGRTTLVTHLAADDAAVPARAGLVVGRAVGPAVTRNRVKRRLRHLLAGRLADLPPGTTLVVRALPPAAEASSAQLGRDLDGALDKLRVRSQTF